MDALVSDLLQWIGPHSRPHAEVLEAWHTSYPRLPVWEEANERGYVQRDPGNRTMVSVTEAGRAFLRAWRQRTT